VLLSLPVRRVNRPDLAATACCKPLQMALAGRHGLVVPDTLMTNVARDVRSFAARQRGETITKMLAVNVIVEDGIRSVAYSRPVCEAALRDLTGVESTTHLVTSGWPTRRSTSWSTTTGRGCSSGMSTPGAGTAGSRPGPERR
jgi:hypothetical protein